MKWATAGQRFEVQVEEVGEEQATKFHIRFLGQCYERLASLGQPFDIGDHMCLALKGSSVHEESRRSSIPNQLSSYIEYRKGVLIQFYKKKSPLKTGMLLVDTFEGAV